MQLNTVAICAVAILFAQGCSKKSSNGNKDGGFSVTTLGGPETDWSQYTPPGFQKDSTISSALISNFERDCRRGIDEVTVKTGSETEILSLDYEKFGDQELYSSELIRDIVTQVTIDTRSKLVKYSRTYLKAGVSGFNGQTHSANQTTCSALTSPNGTYEGCGDVGTQEVKDYIESIRSKWPCRQSTSFQSSLDQDNREAGYFKFPDGRTVLALLVRNISVGTLECSDLPTEPAKKGSVTVMTMEVQSKGGKCARVFDLSFDQSKSFYREWWKIDQTGVSK